MTTSFDRDLAAALPVLRRRALSLARDPSIADDLVQETALRALRFQHHYRSGSSIEAWLLQVLRNAYYSRGRKIVRERRALERYRHDPNLLVDVAPSPNPPLTPSVVRALESLPAVYRDAVTRVDLGDESYGEAAEGLRVPRGTVMSRLHRGRRLLRDELAA